jgi:uncharacterized protein Yka (UPF0111/DUF47 family)
MTEKLHIISNLGEDGILLPAMVNAALAANDRIKYYLTLLQAAVAHAEHPDHPANVLRHERLASGVDDETLDRVVAGSAKLSEGRYSIPGSVTIVSALLRDVETMLRPLADQRGAELGRRFAALKSTAPGGAGDLLSKNDIDALASGNRERGDTLHLLVMDAHKALNAVQVEIASENVDGASAYALQARDRPLIAAFMRGLQRTAPLKFDHPGLATTATHVGKQLVLQNDIGTTDAHVLVIHVDGLRATLTYTDVHLQRLLFLQNLLKQYDVEWEDTRSRRDNALEDGVYHLSVGTFVAADESKLEDYLAFVGSRLVYLIDWNRARKRLQQLLSKNETIGLLIWSAEHDHGHMAFLKAGGEQLIYDALDFVVKGQVRFGERLDEILGVKEARDYLRFVLKACAVSRLRKEPESFIQDAVRAELFNYFRSGQQTVFDVAAEHAALIVEIACGIRDSLMQINAVDPRQVLERNAARAKQWEGRADALVNRARAATKHAGSSDAIRAIIESADDVADELEEAAFHLTLIPAGTFGPAPHPDLQALGELLVQACQEYVKVVETARHVRRGGAREDMQDFLDATHRIMALEHRTDEAQRNVEAALAAGAKDFRVLHVLTESTRNLEQAADALMHCSLQMRDYLLGQVMAA